MLTFRRKNFSFKCHRIDIPTGSMPGSPAVTGSQNVFPINTISFHQTQGTFCTGGGDGSLTFWDGMARTKLKCELMTLRAKLTSSVLCKGPWKRRS